MAELLVMLHSPQHSDHVGIFCRQQESCAFLLWVQARSSPLLLNVRSTSSFFCILSHVKHLASYNALRLLRREVLT